MPFTSPRDPKITDKTAENCLSVQQQTDKMGNQEDKMANNHLIKFSNFVKLYLSLQSLTCVRHY